MMTSQSTDGCGIDDLFISVIIPCRNEARYIARCLESLRRGTWPADRLEVLVVDGRSDDGTVSEIRRMAAEWPVVRLLDNPGRITPIALNIGIRAARGDLLARMDAHSDYPPDYLEALARHLVTSAADNVGGVCRTVPGRATPAARGIAAALAHPLAVGNAQFRTGASAPRWVDTVPFGCYRREVFDRIGLFDEEMVRNQDDEFNHRLLKAGGRIILVPEVVITYYARDTFGKLARMMYQYGLFKPLAAWKVGRVTTVRQVVPAAFVLAVLGALAIAFIHPIGLLALAAILLPYVTLVGLATLRQVSEASIADAVCFAAAVTLIHCSYGVGYLRGIARLAHRLAFRRSSRPADISLTR